MADSNVVRGPGRNKRSWTFDEDTKLTDALMELHVTGKYSADNGFRPGHLKAIQDLLDVSLPGSGLKADPHIKSRMKTLRSNFNVVHDMLVGSNTSGFSFRWDSDTCCVDAEDHVWDEYIKTHKGAGSFRGKALPFYEKFCTIFGLDRASGSRAVDLGEEGDTEETPMSPIEADMDARMSSGPTGSVTSKRKRTSSIDFNDTFRGCTIDLTESIGNSIEKLGDKILESANQQSNAGDQLLDKVITEIENLPTISLNERVKGMHVIGQNPRMAKIFLQLPEEGKICYIQMIRDGPLD